MSKMDPSTRFVRELDGDYFMLREAAEMLDVPQRRLRDFIKDDPENLGPSFCAMFGKIKIYLYTKDDIETIRQHLQDQKKVYRNKDKPGAGGRPRLWTDEQRKERQRLYSQAHYYRLRAAEVDDLELKDEYRQKVALIEKELKS